MPPSFAEKQRAYNKRLLIILPIATALIAMLFMTSDLVPLDNLRKNFGWEGQVRLLPEITIIPDRDPYEDPREASRLRVMTSVDLDIVDEGPEEGGNVTKKPKRPDTETTPQLDEKEIRHYPAHTDVPYSEDYVILHMVQPDYPPAELIAGVEADVTVEILVNEGGSVEDAWVLVADGPRSFEEASLEAVRQFIFKPPTQQGKPVPMWIRFQIRFRLIG
jgi:protein TonB